MSPTFDGALAIPQLTIDELQGHVAGRTTERDAVLAQRDMAYAERKAVLLCFAAIAETPRTSEDLARHLLPFI